MSSDENDGLRDYGYLMAPIDLLTSTAHAHKSNNTWGPHKPTPKAAIESGKHEGVIWSLKQKTTSSKTSFSLR